MTVQIAAVILLCGAFVVAIARRRASLAWWLLIMLVIVLVAEGTQMNAQYRYLYPPTHISKQYKPGCGAMGNGGPTSGGC